ncbi:MAG: glucosyltransferase domain-containing protein [Lachnospiraceae bacterium]|nr:glucosyltransferase domain-containing protein [Lachnospiraceae bacterium]
MEKTVFSGIKEKYDNIDKRIKMCFLSAFICGLFAHIYALTNHLYNYDELWHTPTGFGTGLEVGRWALSITVWIQKVLFDDCFTIPFINGTLTIILYAVAACFVVSALDIKDEFYAIVVGGLMTTFPAFTCRMFFMFTTHYYAIGIAMAATGAWIIAKKKLNILKVMIAIALTVYGMAIYQANFTTAVCILVGNLLVWLITENVELKTAIKKCINYVLYLGACMALFLAGSKIALSITGKQMETYENLDQMGQLSMEQLIEGIIRCYKTFFKLPIIDVYSMNPNRIVKIAFLICFLIFLYTFVKVWMMKKEVYLKVLVSLVFAVLPIAVNLIIIMAISSGTMYSIMVYEIVFVFIISIACLEAIRTCNSDITAIPNKMVIDKVETLLNSVTAVMLVITVITYIWFANGNYLAMEYTNQHDNAYYQTLMTQIKSVDGYHADMPITMIGKPVVDSTYTRQDMIGGTFNISGKSSTNINAYSSWNIMTRVLGYDPVNRNSDEEEEYFRGLDEVVNMPCYPSSGSIKIIDDTIVIKFQEPSELEQ